MTRDDIIRMAREAGFTDASFCRWSAYSDDLERFANLVAAAEREACAQIVQSYMDEAYIGDEGWNVARDVLNDIRARGQHE